MAPIHARVLALANLKGGNLAMVPKLSHDFFRENLPNGKREHFINTFSISKFILPFPRRNYYCLVFFTTFYYGLQLCLFLNECFGGCQIFKHKM